MLATGCVLFYSLNLKFAIVLPASKLEILTDRFELVIPLCGGQFAAGEEDDARHAEEAG
jgi:hypothetical protein